MEVAHECLVDFVHRILGLVKDLVGKLDFSYHAAHISAMTSNSVLEDSVEGKHNFQ